MGPIILDLLGTELSAEERELLQHPLVGGVILFSRNYHSPEQITELCQTIRQSRTKPLLITVDQEGGRVQRLKNGFVRLLSMGEIGNVYQRSAAEGEKLAYTSGWMMAKEVLSVGIDLSFAPVIDLNKKLNTVIGDRGFASDAETVIALGAAFIRGMKVAGMAATGKHFPGHGSVTLDSHVALPVDNRSFTTVFQDDMQPFVQLMRSGLDAVMPAHIIFSSADEKPVGFSSYWLKKILREKLNFTGVIFSDDLNMAGASFAGGYADRAHAALEAGCDMALICNNRQGAVEILDKLNRKFFIADEKFQTLRGKYFTDRQTLHASTEWKNYLNLYVQYGKLYENN